MASAGRSDPDLQNQLNLTEMWSALGASSVAGLEGKGGMLAEGWPDRAWLRPGEVPSQQDLEAFDLARGGRSILLPVWGDAPELRGALSAAGYQEVLVQSALSRRLEGQVGTVTRAREVEVLRDPELLPDWTQAVSAAFGYAFDPGAAQRLFLDPRATIFLASSGGEISGTGVTYSTESTVGVYWVGVVPQHRRRGLARALMNEIMAQVAEQGPALLTLQASAAGRHLYGTLGFEGETTIHTYRA